MSKVENNNDMNVGCITNQNMICYLKFIFFYIINIYFFKDHIFNLFNLTKSIFNNFFISFQLKVYIN